MEKKEFYLWVVLVFLVAFCIGVNIVKIDTKKVNVKSQLAGPALVFTEQSTTTQNHAKR
jgi:hypothetical protein